MYAKLVGIGSALGALAGILFALPLILGRIDTAAMISTAVIVVICVIIGASVGLSIAILSRKRRADETFLPKKGSRPLSPMPLIVVSIVSAAIGTISRLRLLLSSDIHVNDSMVMGSLIGLLIGTFLWIKLLLMLHKRAVRRFEASNPLVRSAVSSPSE